MIYKRPWPCPLQRPMTVRQEGVASEMAGELVAGMAGMAGMAGVVGWGGVTPSWSA